MNEPIGLEELDKIMKLCLENGVKYINYGSVGIEFHPKKETLPVFEEEKPKENTQANGEDILYWSTK